MQASSSGEEYLTRRQVVRKLIHFGATAGKLIDWERRKGWIRRSHKKGGRVYYRAADVSALERQLAESRTRCSPTMANRGELARRAFSSFRAGLGVADTVIALGVSPEIVYELRAYYSPNDLIVTGALRDELTTIGEVVGFQISGPAELLGLLRALVDHVSTCELSRMRDRRS